MRAYRIYRGDNENHVYIGITTRTVLHRWKQHIVSAKRGDATKLARAIRKYGAAAFKVEEIACCRTLEDLLATEKLLIAQWNSYNRGYNMTVGGGGLPGYHPTQETIRRRSESLKRVFADPLVRAQRSEARKREQAADPSIQQRRIDGLKRALATPEGRKKKSDANRRIANDPIVQKKKSEGTRRTWADPVIRQRRIAAMQRSLAHPSERTRRSEAGRRHSANEVVRRRRRERNLLAWSDPRARERRVTAMKCAANDPLRRQHRKEVSARVNADPAIRQRKSEKMKAKWAARGPMTSEEREQASSATKRQWADPKIRARMIEGLRLAAIRRKEKP